MRASLHVKSEQLQSGSYLGGTGESVTALADADVEAEFSDLQVPHRVLELGLVNHSGDWIGGDVF
jgi:hypothetical protein